MACFTAFPPITCTQCPPTFDPSCSGHTGAGKDISNLVKFEWDFNNDGVYEFLRSQPTSWALTRPQWLTYGFGAGFHTLRMRVTDDQSTIAVSTVTIELRNPPNSPIAQAGGPYLVSLCAGDTLTLDGSKSYDPDGGSHLSSCPACPNDYITSWQWDLTSGAWDFTDATGEKVTIANPGSFFSSPDNYTIGLRVTDNTAAAYPPNPNRTGDGYADVAVYSGCLCTITAGKLHNGQIRLSWDNIGADSYELLKSSQGPNTGFTVAATLQQPEAYVQTALAGSWYRVKAITGDEECLSAPMYIGPAAGDDTYYTEKDTPLMVTAPGVLDNDTNGGAGLTAILADTVSSGILSFRSDGSFGYIPNAGFVGTDNFTYRVTNGTDQSTPAQVKITVKVHAITAAADSYTTEKNGLLSIDAPGVLTNDTDEFGHSLMAIVVDQPAHGSLALNSDGSFVYAPDNGFSGTDNFTYKVTDGIKDSSPATVTITVNTHAITAGADTYATAKNATLTVDSPGVLDNDTDELGHGLFAILVTTAAHGSLTLSANGSFSYIPDENYSGADSFTYKATDGVEESFPATVNIKVTTHAIIAKADSYATGKNITLTVPVPGVLDNDTDDLGHTLAPILTATTAHGALGLNQNGSFIYTPAAGFTGTDSFSYKVNDGADNSTAATVTITVSAHAITAAADSYSTQKKTQLTVSAPGVLANDTDSLGHGLTALFEAAPLHGSFALSADGSFIYMPEDGFTGSDSFTYKSFDGFDESSPATVTITVNSHAITAAADNYTAEKNEILQVDAAAGALVNDNDELGHSLTALKVSEPAHGTVSLAADGSFIYIPEKNYTGQDSFTYKVNDSIEDSAPATVTITVGKKCPMVQLYGEGSSQVELLRRYRDGVLAKTAVGRTTIKLYYRLAPIADGILERNAPLRSMARWFADRLLPLLRTVLKF